MYCCDLGLTYLELGSGRDLCFVLEVDVAVGHFLESFGCCSHTCFGVGAAGTTADAAVALEMNVVAALI